MIAIALTSWAFWWEPSYFSVRETSLVLPNWPASCGGLRVVVLADLHVGSPFNQLDKLEEIVASTNSIKPDVFPELPAGIALTIAGHTHGGQVNIPLIGRPVTASKYGERYASGHIMENGRHLFVSPGLGTSILPVRFRVPPEISMLIIHGLSQ